MKPRKTRTPSRGRKSLTMFSFGYWGNGRGVDKLVRAIDSAERDRGYAPPLWVDIRLRRNVRAEGFRGDLFEQRMGARYVWMPDLGNVRVASGDGGIRIQKPAAASELLELALADRDRRVLFFCACEDPCHCHRRTVSKLLVTAARRRGVRLQVVEWPGDEPVRIEIPVARADLVRALRGDLWRVPLPSTMPAKAAAAVPWGSVARLHASDSDAYLIVGPARFGTHGPYLQVLEWSAKEPDAERGLRVRKKLGAAPLSSAGD